jgi:hypothetical protein
MQSYSNIPQYLCIVFLLEQPIATFSFNHLTIIRRKRGDYRGMFTETKSM